MIRRTCSRYLCISTLGTIIMSQSGRGAPAPALLTVSASASISGEQLQLTVRLRNSASRMLYVFDRPQDFARYGAQEGLGSIFSWVSLWSDRILILGMIIPVLPRGMSVEQAFVPCATALEPGQEATHEVHVRWPIREVGPYSPWVPDASTTTVLSLGAQIWVDYVPASDSLWVAPVPQSSCFNLSGFAYDSVLRASATIDGLRVPVAERQIKRR